MQQSKESELASRLQMCGAISSEVGDYQVISDIGMIVAYHESRIFMMMIFILWKYCLIDIIKEVLQIYLDSVE